MTRKTRLLAVGALAIVITVPIEEALLPTPGEPACLRAEAWLKAHGADMSQTLAALSALPPSYRRVVFTRFSPEAKAAVWRQQLSDTLGKEQVTVEQAALISRLYGAISPTWYAGAPPIEEIEKFQREFAAAFTPEQMSRYHQLGGNTVPRGDMTSLSARWSESIRSKFTAILYAEDGCGNCNCNMGSTWDNFRCWDGGTQGCFGGHLPCQTVFFGCGFSGFAECDGTCGGNCPEPI